MTELAEPERPDEPPGGREPEPFRLGALVIDYRLRRVTVAGRAVRLRDFLLAFSWCARPGARWRGW